MRAAWPIVQCDTSSAWQPCKEWKHCDCRGPATSLAPLIPQLLELALRCTIRTYVYIDMYAFVYMYRYGCLQVLLSRAEKDYPRSNPPPLRFIRSCSSSLAAATLEKLEKAFGVPVLEVAFARSHASADRRFIIFIVHHCYTPLSTLMIASMIICLFQHGGY